MDMPNYDLSCKISIELERRHCQKITCSAEQNTMAANQDKSSMISVNHSHCSPSTIVTKETTAAESQIPVESCTQPPRSLYQPLCKSKVANRLRIIPCIMIIYSDVIIIIHNDHLHWCLFLFININSGTNGNLFKSLSKLICPNLTGWSFLAVNNMVVSQKRRPPNHPLY